MKFNALKSRLQSSKISFRHLCLLCSCRPGYTGDGRHSCRNVDECSKPTLNDCHAQASCTDTTGSYSCQCRTGYEGDGVTCRDEDECQNSSIAAQCHEHAQCTNTDGSYDCRCRQGFVRGSEKALRHQHECVDFNECHQRPCHSQANCKNTHGSFSCTCKAGYEGDGEYDCRGKAMHGVTYLDKWDTLRSMTNTTYSPYFSINTIFILVYICNQSCWKWWQWRTSQVGTIP